LAEIARVFGGWKGAFQLTIGPRATLHNL
jgi:hypothetical protein